VHTYRQAFASLQAAFREGNVPAAGTAGEPLTKARLEAWVIWLKKRGVTPGGINMYARTVNSYLSWKYSEGLAPERLRIRLLPDPKKPVSLISPGELRLLSIHRPKDWYGQRTRTLALLMCDTGVRIAEALSLEAAKVSWDGLHMEVMGKGRRPRQVPFSEGLRRAIWPLEQRRLRKRPDCPWLFHSDSGRQLSYHNAYSMSRRADCYDNAVMEAFFSTVKREEAECFPSYGDAKMALFDYIEVFYNQRRRHSTLGLISPAAFERQAAA
jgi:site-specific recombinase XerD